MDAMESIAEQTLKENMQAKKTHSTQIECSVSLRKITISKSNIVQSNREF